ncbi:hypothetical protein PanWU01x14_314350 [Parasponia andersonii]|uniref:Uncharacterized protein n=1 Tax=Parasponia andersonii TaxID=3476 RepID=A0A2P5ANT6_PARAD|nr:hypothetical protein PanWU01x14_314350 [Parasponia andersonii]
MEHPRDHRHCFELWDTNIELPQTPDVVEDQVFEQSRGDADKMLCKVSSSKTTLFRGPSCLTLREYNTKLSKREFIERLAGEDRVQQRLVKPKSCSLGLRTCF